MIKQPLLSVEMLAVADALRQVRLRICQLVALDRLPSTFDGQAVSDLLCHGLTVAAALEALARDGP
ncbi:MAG TPA: hypothetical protein VH682_24655 [Gemmataceae bacterium]